MRWLFCYNGIMKLDFENINIHSETLMALYESSLGVPYMESHWMITEKVGIGIIRQSVSDRYIFLDDFTAFESHSDGLMVTMKS